MSQSATTSSYLILFLLCSIQPQYSVATKGNAYHSHLFPSYGKDNIISKTQFSSILSTALDDEVTWQHALHQNEERRLKKLRQRKNDRGASELDHEYVENHSLFTENEAWEGIFNHGWSHSKKFSNSKFPSRNLRPDTNGTSTTSHAVTDSKDRRDIRLHPFLLCSQFPGLSGYQRLQRIIIALDADISKTQTTMNTDDQSCFVILTTPDAIEDAYRYEKDLLTNVSFGPLVDILKIASRTPYAILGGEWATTSGGAPAVNKLRSSFNDNDDSITTEETVWRRSIMVDFVPGGVDLDGVQRILDDVRAMADASSNTDSATSKLRSIHTAVTPTRDAFSLTSATSFERSSNLRMFRSRHNIWSQALTNGFEKSHGCNVMFDHIEMTSRGEEVVNEKTMVSGVELILTAPKTGDYDGSALNTNCALSLVMGLSVHPLVGNVEVGQHLELSSVAVKGKSNPQWITQSAVVDHRPFFDKGLDGTGQIVAVADGGLDTDNCYFRDSKNSPFGGWDKSRRKIAYYDDSFADQLERPKGHGTYVSGIIVGRKSSNGVDNEVGFADGTAPGSKITFFDMEIGYNGIADPGVSRLFSSFYNSGDGAFISNASWGRGYNGLYSSFCRDYDGALRSTYSDVLLVVSAGNTGVEGIAGTIQNPADCKSPMAVGSSLSYGDDIRSHEKGIEYLADYSSRGPTADGRIKPDIVAPGHFIVAPNADPSTEGECDGSSSPNIRRSIDVGSGVRYVSGTSMASPVVTGSAAILRQYFEEGYCTSGRCCGSKGCGESFTPSGTLMKAVLMNGAQPLIGGIQRVPDGNILNDQPLKEYDGNQGMGRINLVNSVPLEGENDIQLMTINDKFIDDGDKDEFRIKIDSSNGCNEELRVTLAWYDPPGAVGCLKCLVNDMDLIVEEVGGDSDVFYPNGLSQYDTSNTVERIRMQVSDGQEFRVIVHSRNFAFNRQQYSLAITGCLAEEDELTPDLAEAMKSSPDCSGDELFTFKINTADTAHHLRWSLIGSTPNNGIETIASGPGPELGYVYEANETYYHSYCLTEGTKYRFQVKNSVGSGIGSGSYSLSYGGDTIFDSDSDSSGDFGDVKTHRFQVSNSVVKILGKNRSINVDDEIV